MEILKEDTSKFDVRCKLTNRDISIHYRGEEYWFMRSDFLGAFAYWVVKQSPYDVPNITNALEAFKYHISEKVDSNMPTKFTYDELSALIDEKVFESIPEIEQLNHPKISTGKGYENRYDNPHPDYDFIDLGALARNVFYMILREQITQS